MTNAIRKLAAKCNPNKIRSDRYRRAAWTSATLIVSQLLAFLTGFVTIPLISRYVGSELFGLWMMLTNFVSFLVFADLGVGIGFQNELIRCYATDNKGEAGTWVGNAMLIMLCMAALLFFASFLIVPLLPWQKLLTITSNETMRWIVPSMQSLVLSFSIGLPGMLLQYIGNAYQRGYWVYSLLSLARIISLIGVSIGCYLGQSLPTLIAVYIATPHIASLVGLAVLWMRVPWLRPSYRGLGLGKMKKLFHVGLGMLGVRITHAFAMQGPAYITASLQGLAEAGMVAVIQKVLIVPTIMTQSILVATQGAAGEAAHKGEWLWVRRNLIKLTELNVAVFILAAIVIVGIGGQGMRVLLGTSTGEPSRILLALYCIHSGFSTIRFTFGTFLTVVNRVYSQALYRSAALLCALGILFGFEQTSVSIIAVFVVSAELPTFVCTVLEAWWIVWLKKPAL
jgi:O-antigen/teichoic acid export membrane protein